MFGSLGFTELILILFIVLIIFGAGKLPQLGEGIGKAIKGFKKSVHEADAIEAEAQAQAICMQHPDFRAAYDAWVKKEPTFFQGSTRPFSAKP